MRHKIAITTVLFLISHFFVSANGFSPEVRAIWLTTNLGLDWPVKETDPGKQKKALCQMLDKLNDANFNLVFFKYRLTATFYGTPNTSLPWPMLPATGPAS